MSEDVKSVDQDRGRSVDDLIREMREKAAAEKREILDAAGASVRQIEERSSRECERIEQEALAEIEAESKSERDRILGEVFGARRREWLVLKREAMKEVLDEAAKVITARIGGAGYAEALESLIREGLEFVGPGAAVQVSNEDVEVCRKIVAARKLDCGVGGGGETRGDLTVTSRDGKRSVENGFRTRLARAAETGTADVAKALFGQRPADA